MTTILTDDMPRQLEKKRRFHDIEEDMDFFVDAEDYEEEEEEEEHKDDDRMDLDHDVSGARRIRGLRAEERKANAAEEVTYAQGLHMYQKPGLNDLQGKINYRQFFQIALKVVYEMPESFYECLPSTLPPECSFLHVTFSTINREFTQEWIDILADVERTQRMDEKTHKLVRFFMGITALNYLLYERRELQSYFVSWWIGSRPGERTWISWTLPDFLDWVKRSEYIGAPTTECYAVACSVALATYCLETRIPDEWVPTSLRKLFLEMNFTQELEKEEGRQALACPEILPLCTIIGHWRMDPQKDMSFQVSRT